MPGNNYRHGQRHTRLYSIWCGMKTRCYNENDKVYRLYGAKGVAICEEWQKFEPFYEWSMSNGYKDTLTIDRIDNAIGYCPENCRWVSIKVQANNKSTNHWLTYDGKTQTIAQWSEEYGIKYHTLYRRLNKGWGAEKALTTKTRIHKRRSKYDH